MQHGGSPGKACVGGPCSASEAASENPSREKEKKIPKSNSKTSCANKALVSLEFETEDMHKIVLPAVQARAQQFMDWKGVANTIRMLIKKSGHLVFTEEI